MASCSPWENKEKVSPWGYSPTITEQKDQESKTKLVFKMESTEDHNSTKKFHCKLNPSLLRSLPVAHFKIDQVHAS